MLQSLLNRVMSLQAGMQSGEIIRAALLPHESDILETQKEQLAEGKASSGEDIRPYYSEDLKANGGYFHSVQTARNYAGWKVDIGNPYEVGNRNFDAPNLYINGKFYGELGIDFGADAVGVSPGKYIQRKNKPSGKGEQPMPPATKKEEKRNDN